MAQQITSSEWGDKVLLADKPTLVDFFATWCGPCKMMSPVVDEFAETVGDRANVYKLDIDQNQDIAQQYGVMSVPTFIMFKGGEPVNKRIGAVPIDQLEAMLD